MLPKNALQESPLDSHPRVPSQPASSGRLTFGTDETTVASRIQQLGMGEPNAPGANSTTTTTGLPIDAAELVAQNAMLLREVQVASSTAQMALSELRESEANPHRALEAVAAATQRSR